MLPGKKYSPEDIVAILKRRRWLILIPFAIGVALAPVLATLVPQRYRSETLILVVPQRVPDAYVKSTVTQSIEDRLPAISEQILSRSRLERIITELDLYRKERETQVMEDVVRTMRERDINLSLAANGPDRSLDSFRISYVSTDPATAQKVTQQLAAMTIDQNTRDRAAQAESTNQFLERELQTAKARLLQHEEKLEAYKRQHSGQLPSQLTPNLQAMSNAQMQLQQVGQSINTANERRIFTERQLADAMALPPAPAPAGAQEAAPSAAQQLQAAEAAFERMKLRITPDHPDWRTAERTIADLKVRVAEEQSAPRPAVQRPMSATELAHENRIRDLKATLAMIDAQIAGLSAEERRLKATIAGYQTKIDALPSRESELVELTRDYQTLDLGYRTLLQKWEDSKIAANLESGQIGEQFRVLDAASLPERPYNRNQRLGVTASGAIAGLVLGLLVVGFLEFRDSTFRREEDIARALTLPVLAVVPALTTERERTAFRRRTRLADAAGIGVLVLSAAVIVIWRLVL